MLRGLQLTFLLFVLAVGARAQAPKSRKELIPYLHTCAKRPNNSECEIAAERAIKLFNSGDKSMLGPLLSLSLNSNAAQAEMLGDFYANVLWKQPGAFLRALKARPFKEQRHLAWHVAVTDGGGMHAEMLKDVRRNLHQLSGKSGGPLRRVARLCLAEVEKVNSTKGE